MLTGGAYAEARKILGRGGWAWLDQATIQAVRNGAQPGDPLSALWPRPFIRNVTDAEVSITGSGPGRRIVVLFPMRTFLAFASGTGSDVSPTLRVSRSIG